MRFVFCFLFIQIFRTAPTPREIILCLCPHPFLPWSPLSLSLFIPHILYLFILLFLFMQNIIIIFFPFMQSYHTCITTSQPQFFLGHLKRIFPFLFLGFTPFKLSLLFLILKENKIEGIVYDEFVNFYTY